uniref:Cytochrome c oxidase subunit 7C, mitochondrial n=1 Tax=Suricata suricatta TaxID=37032 RepID=A0A673SZW3_SURSU
VLGQSVQKLTTSVVCRSHYDEGLEKNLPFSVRDKCQLLIVLTVHFGSGFVASFFIVRHQLFKK